MATMQSFCRITGHARNLPKPCYFPLLPPISPADAKKLCRITGKAYFSHHYTPIIAFGKPIKFDGISGCRITKHEDFSYLRICPFKNKENNKHYKFYKELITKVKSHKNRTTESGKSYVYSLGEDKKSIIIPSTIEEGIRMGEIENLSLSNGGDHIAIKVKQGLLIKVGIENVDSDEIEKLDNLYYGEGQNGVVLEDQKKTLAQRKRKKLETSAKTQLFEEKDRRADEDEIKSKTVIKSKRPKIVFDAKKRKEKKKLLAEMVQEEKDNKAILPPTMDFDSKSDNEEPLIYQKMFSDIKNAQAYALKLNVIGSPEFNSVAAEKAEQAGFDWEEFPQEEVIEAVEIPTSKVKPLTIIPSDSIHPLDIVAVSETVNPVEKMNSLLARQISNLKPEAITQTKNVDEKIMAMEAINLIPDITQIDEISKMKPNKLSHGYLVEKNSKAHFVPTKEYQQGNEKSIPGVMVAVQNEMKFVSGQIIRLADQESFVAGKTVQTSEGDRFVPGQTIVTTGGKISFIPGTVVSSKGNEAIFSSGRLVDNDNEPTFVPGQMVKISDGKEVFAAGQTVITTESPKFVPGETVSDGEGDHEFVPGIAIPCDGIDKFIPGQVYQSKDGIAITPGQIVPTYEGPSFIPGTSIEASDGSRKFIQGTTFTTDDGEVSFERQKTEIPIIKEELVIPTRNLHLLVEPQGEVIGFNVNPLNTADVNKGERLYGAIVEMDDSVLFYLTGKLPKDMDPGAKVISGELRVGDGCQRFIPGKMQASTTGEKFVPGQVVRTEHGEEFVPGQIVETSDGPKFVPGQVIMTAEGEKFVPGQVIVHEDGPKFVPGQIIQTENGATFIPGQMMNTDEGRKFVPGQLIDTKEGPMFVPGQVLETNEGPKFVPGIIVETEEGLKYVPSEADDQEEDIEFSFQGFDMTPEELILLSQSVDNANRHSPVSGQQGLIDSSTLKKLAADNMVIHGRTPEPVTQDPMKSRSKKNVGFSAPDEESDVDMEDSDMEKVEILRGLLKAESTVSDIRKQRELKKILTIMGEIPDVDEQSASVVALNYILQTSQENGEVFRAFIGNDEQLVCEILSGIGNMDNIERNDQVKKLIHNSLRSIVTKKCNKEINEMINAVTSDPQNLLDDPRIQILLTEAVGIVCVTGDVEAAKLLEQVISDPTNIEKLREDKDIMNVLKQLFVLHEMGKRDASVADTLLELSMNPEEIQDKEKVHQLIKRSSMLLRREEERSKPFDIRHVASSKDIPTELFEQIKEDKEQAEQFIENLPDELFYAIMGDNRCGEKLLDSLDSSKMSGTVRELDKFKNGMAVVVIKENMQAVIPRQCARSVCYGIIPYILIDEEGFKFFERGLTGRKLAPCRVIENTWLDDGYSSGYYPQRAASSGQQYSMMFLGQNYDQPSLQYTSLLPASGPTRLSYPPASRRPSRESSVVPLRLPSRSATPSRRSSVSSQYEPPPYINNTYEPYARSRRSSVSSTAATITRPMSPIDTAALEREYLKEINPETALIPYVEDETEETPSVPRSDTVANLLDKYTNFSVEKEFNRPVIGHKQKAKNNMYLDLSDDDEDYGTQNRSSFPLGGRGRRSLTTPDRTKGSIKQNGHSRLDDDITKKNRQLCRPFSDIFEVDELESPTGEKTVTPKNLSSKKGGKKKNKQKKSKAKSSENGFTPFPIGSRDNVSPLSDDDDLQLYQITRPTRSRMRSNPPVAYVPDSHQRRLSEPRFNSNNLPDYSPSRGPRARSYGGDLSPLRYNPMGSKTTDKKTRRYKPLDQSDEDDSDDLLGVVDPYKSPYLSKSIQSSSIDDDPEERPSYKLLGKHYGRPYGRVGERSQRRYTSPLLLGSYGGAGPSYAGGMQPYGGMNSTYGLDTSSYGPSISPYDVNRSPYSSGIGVYGGGAYNGGSPYAGGALYGGTPYGLGNMPYGNNLSPYNTGMGSYGQGGPSYNHSVLNRHNSYHGGEYGPKGISSSIGQYSSPYTGGYSSYGNGNTGRPYDMPPTNGQHPSLVNGVNERGSREPSALRGGMMIPPKNKPINRQKYLDVENGMENDSDVRLNMPKIKKFDASRYLNDDIDDDEEEFDVGSLRLNGDDNDDDDAPDPRKEQRQMASSIAKKYMRSFSLGDDDENEEDESS